MNELTAILAALVIVAHLAVIFWPRKPILEPTDENGMPVVWHNQDTERKDIACIWRESADETAPAPTAAAPAPVTSFSEVTKPLGASADAPKRSVA